ncbi:MAG: hypothetical protein ACREHV_05225, partial [Rhizomicrobium sp.]
LGDGSLLVYVLGRSGTSELALSFQPGVKKVMLGNAPLQLLPLSLPRTTSEEADAKSVVFVLSETPFIIQPSVYGKLSFVHVNVKVGRRETAIRMVAADSSCDILILGFLM